MVETMGPHAMGEFKNDNSPIIETKNEKIRHEELELFLKSKVFKEHNIVNHLKVRRGNEDLWAHFARCYSFSNDEENIKKYSINKGTIAYIPSIGIYCLVECTNETTRLLNDLGFERGDFEAFPLEEEVILEGDELYEIREKIHHL